MSILEQMIAGEKITDAYENWRDYRRRLTDFILSQCIGRQEMQADADKQISGKPVLAIWGAGACNDIDLGRLTPYFYLVLIDRDRESMISALQTYGLDETQAVCADLLFWDIPYDTYELLEHLLSEAADAELVIEFLHRIAEKNSHSIRIETTRSFNYSVAVGLHSQLNARLAGLLYSYRKYYSREELEEFHAALQALNQLAVTRLNDLMYTVTHSSIIWGYELASIGTGDTVSGPEAFYRAGAGQVQPEHIEGAWQLEQDIALHNGGDIDVTAEISLIWPFCRQEGLQKSYEMRLVAAKK